MRSGVKNIYLAIMVHDVNIKQYLLKNKMPNFDRLDNIIFFTDSVAIGSGAIASSNNSIAIGYMATATNYE